MVNCSFDIIDLIEVGDYVNGTEVVEKYLDQKSKKWILKGGYHPDYAPHIYYSNSEIKSIVTKEQFESMEYEV